MGIVVAPKISISPLVIKPERRRIGFKLLREGEETGGAKEVRIYSSPRDPYMAAFFPASMDGVTTLVQDFLASAIDGFVYVVGIDDSPPPKFKGAGLEVVSDEVFVFDISTDSSAGVPTEPATAQAIVNVDDLPAKRVVVAIEKTSAGEWRVCGFGETVTGELDLELQVASGNGYAIALDDFGAEFLAGAAVEIGRRVRPTVFRGWLYEVTEAGNLPSTEPEWWIAEGQNAARLIGTARVVAVRYYRPLAHGPFPFELT